MAGQADGDRTDHAVSGMGRAPDHDHRALAGAGIAEGGRHGDQLIRDEPLAPLELPVRPAGPCRPWRCLLCVDGVSVLASFTPDRVKWPRPGWLIPGRGPAQEAGR